MKNYLNHIFIDGLAGMAHGLFATLIVGTIIQQIGLLAGGSTGDMIYLIGKMAAAVTGAGIGVGVACRFKESTLVVVSAAITGMVGAFACKLLAGAVLVEGAIVLAGPGEPLGAMINWGTEQQPFLMGIVVSVLMGMILTLPISSAALGIILNLSGIAAGAATVGCCCNMVGFAVASYRENGVGGLLAQGIGTSMLQMPNIVRKPVIWLPAILSSAILGPISTMLLHMTNNATGSGMGTAGLVGQIMTWQTMAEAEPTTMVLLKILAIQIILPAIATLLISEFMRKKGWIAEGDMKLEM